MTAVDEDEAVAKEMLHPVRRQMERDNNPDAVYDAYEGAIDRLDAIEKLAMRILNMCASARRDLLT
jgi:hypothetical protein